MKLFKRKKDNMGAETENINSVDEATVKEPENLDANPNVETVKWESDLEKFARELDLKADAMFEWSVNLTENEQYENAEKAKVMAVTLTTIAECARIADSK